MDEQASLEFNLNFGDVLLHKPVQAYSFNMFRCTLYIIYQSELIQTQFFNFNDILSKLFLNVLWVHAILRYESSKSNNCYNCLILKFEKITKIFAPFFKINILGVKIRNLKKSFIPHLIIYIKLAYIQIWSQSVILANDLCKPSVKWSV